jgi:hypothetical protein
MLRNGMVSTTHFMVHITFPVFIVRLRVQMGEHDRGINKNVLVFLQMLNF